MLGILGSGFGLYGYLPAAVGAGHEQILLPVRYSEILNSRSELRRFHKFIRWTETDEELIETASSVVFSRRPCDQYSALAKLLVQPQLRRIIFEKPLAPDPGMALNMLEMMKGSDKHFSIGFILRYTHWAISIRKRITAQTESNSQTWLLKWHFHAHHFKHDLANWKRDHGQGGGVLRFYGIHFVALLAEWGFSDVVLSEIDKKADCPKYSYWQAVFRGAGLPEIRIEIDSNSAEQEFSISNAGSKEPQYFASDIFDSGADGVVSDEFDKRSKYLELLLLETGSSNDFNLEMASDSVNLWALIEESTKLF